MFNKSEKTFIFIILVAHFFNPISLQLSSCVKPELLFDFKNFTLESNFNYNLFIKKNFPKTNTLKQHGITYSGAGNYGFVILLNLRDKQTQEEFEVALKITRYADSDDKLLMDNEIAISRSFSHQYPLSAPIFFECAFHKGSKTAFILTEPLNYSLNTQRFAKKKYDPVTLLGFFILMTRSLVNLHLTGKSHNDVKPENFMLLDKKTPIVKLIDFGFAMNTNTDFDGGTAHYLAPDTFTTSKTSRSFDGYSLGITFYQLLYPLDDSILFSTTQQFANKYARNQFYKTRVATANSMSLSAKLSYEKNKQDINRLARMTMSSVIARLVKVNASERVDLPTVVTELEKTLKLINPNSLYLEENEEQLFGSIYTDSRYMFERYTKNFVQSEDGIFSKFICGCTSSRKSSKKDKVNQIAAAQITQIEPVLSFNYPNKAKIYHQNDLGATYREYTNPLKVDKGAVRKLNRIKMI